MRMLDQKDEVDTYECIQLNMYMKSECGCKQSWTKKRYKHEKKEWWVEGGQSEM